MTERPSTLLVVALLATPARADPSRLTGAWPANANLAPSLGNGRVGWLVNSETMFLSGLFCAKRNLLIYSGARRCRIPAPQSLRTTVDAVSRGIELDLTSATVTEQLTTADPNITLARSWYAHRSRPGVLVSEIVLTNRGPAAVSIRIGPNASTATDHDVVLSPAPSGLDGAVAAAGDVAHMEKGAPATNVAIVWSTLNTSLHAPAGGTGRFTLLCAVRTGPNSTASLVAMAAADLSDARAMGSAALAAEHAAAWGELWRGGIEIGGNDELAQQVNASLYALLSSTRAGEAWPVGPGGLSTDGYGGNGFWDNDVWAAPALLPWWPELTREALDYRWQRRDAAAAFAKSHGHAGWMCAARCPLPSTWQQRPPGPMHGLISPRHVNAGVFPHRGHSPPFKVPRTSPRRRRRFPWQTAATGAAVDLAPPFNELEQHVGGGISLLAQRLYDATHADEVCGGRKVQGATGGQGQGRQGQGAPCCPEWVTS